ncbi:hypothetical protein PRK78_006785 [Emydomyces testavorans]|uniref:Uncharacterized protein n=1 Tax=Emydomyces testavorans TaxID=2070801 RepID=A0AAF0DQU3_9EURO|nr:hypothetical protein PRK78_006785 [Emydomyces testavorans]
MPTQLDKVLSSKQHGASGEMKYFLLSPIQQAVSTTYFTSSRDQSTHYFIDPEFWTPDELRRWLRARNLLPSDNSTQSELLERVQANMRPSSTS